MNKCIVNLCSLGCYITAICVSVVLDISHVISCGPITAVLILRSTALMNYMMNYLLLDGKILKEEEHKKNGKTVSVKVVMNVCRYLLVTGSENDTVPPS